MIMRVLRWFGNGVMGWWSRRVERDLSRDSQWREERQARVQRLDREVRSLERAAVRRSR
jgi:hypothetical protein